MADPTFKPRATEQVITPDSPDAKLNKRAYAEAVSRQRKAATPRAQRARARAAKNDLVVGTPSAADAIAQHKGGPTARQRLVTGLAAHQQTDRTIKGVGAKKSFGQGGLKGITNDIKGISGPQFTSNTGAVVGLITLNAIWSMFRLFTVSGPTGGTANPTVRHAEIRILTGAWIVGLGVLIIHEFNPRLAMLFALLLFLGNVLSDGAANQVAINSLSALLGGNFIAGTATPAPTGPNPAG